MAVDSSYFDIETYFGDSTEEVQAFVQSLVDTLVPIWQSYEAGLLVVNAIVTFPQEPALYTTKPLKFNSINIPTGSIVGTKPFNGIKSNFPGPFVENGIITDHMSHFLGALDLGFQLTMLKWASSLSFSKNSGNFGFGFILPPYTQFSPGIAAQGIPRNIEDTKMTNAIQGLELKTALKDQILKFVFNKRLFDQKTEYLVEFVGKIANMFDNAVSMWLENSYVYGGSLLAFYAPGGTPVSPSPLAVAFKIG